MRWLLRLYPRAWRRRYGDEFLALLEDAPLSLRMILDCLRGAADAHLRPQITDADSAAPSTPSAPSQPSAAPPIDTDARPSLRARIAATGSYETAIDRILREAQERGEFDDLAGTGKPLHLDDNPYADEWSLAYGIVKQAGYTLPWIALGREIDVDTERLRMLLDQAASHLRSLRTSDQNDGAAAHYESERSRLREQYLEEAATLDRKLVTYNAAVPTWRMDRGRLPPHVAAHRFDRACPAW